LTKLFKEEMKLGSLLLKLRKNTVKTQTGNFPVWKKLEILHTKGYNEKEHNSLIQENRAEWLKSLTFVIEVGFIKYFDDLKNTLDKLKVFDIMQT
jgi:hypothetical protein